MPPDTDGILSDILELEIENSNNLQSSISQKPCFDLKCDLFSVISDDELIKVSHIAAETDKRFIEPLHQSDLDELVRRWLSKKTESKSKWAINLFLKWLEDRKKKRSIKHIKEIFSTCPMHT